MAAAAAIFGHLPTTDPLVTVVKRYVADWGTGAFMVFGGALVGMLAPPQKKSFLGDDPALAGTFLDGSEDDVSVPWYVTLAFGSLLPVAVVFALHRALREWPAQSARQLHHALLAVWTAGAAAVFLWGCVTVFVGRPRPDFLARCVFDAAAGRCTGSGSDIREGRKSFFPLSSVLPSATLGVVALHASGALALWDGAGYLWKLALVVAWPFMALFLGLAAVPARKNHLGDVLTGMALGYAIAAAAYLMLFHVPWGARAGIPRLVRDTVGMSDPAVERILRPKAPPAPTELPPIVATKVFEEERAGGGDSDGGGDDDDDPLAAHLARRDEDQIEFDP